MGNSKWNRLLLLPLFASTFATAAIYRSSDDLSTKAYDFIIIGGGTAGNVVANRLSENPANSVLVLEAGGTNQDVLDSIVPFYCLRLPGTAWDWNYTTVPQTHLNDRAIPYPRGFILGGSSSINYMVYTRGSADDWNRYARLVGDPGWSWNNIQPYFKKNERFLPPADHQNITGEFDPSLHSFNGINSVSLPSYSEPIDSRVIQATKETPDEFHYNVDYNSGIQPGIGWTQYTIGGGKRSSSATSYLGPEYIGRRNLHVLLHATVSRIIPVGSSQGKPVIRQVEFKDSVSGKLVRMTARKEVILSAGSIGTPHILLNSGIGDASDLTKLGIKTVLNLPSVGRNLSDHTLLNNIWPTNATTTFESFARNSTWQTEALNKWTAHQTGILTAGVANQIGWLRVRNTTIFENVTDYVAGPNTGHFEFLIINGIPAYPLPPGTETLSTLAIVTAVLAPASRGTVTINSTDPFAAPLIDPNYFSAEPDLSVMREAVRSARRFVAAPAWNDYIIGPQLLVAGETDEDLNEYIRANTATVFHPVGTSAMSPKGAKWGVVDPDLKVKGMIGLRVVDASVLPLIPAAHTQVPTYIIAERASDLIKQCW